MAKVAKNLTLDPKVVEKAQEYAARHDQSLSELVGELLESVVRKDAAGKGRFSPAVSRLMGAGKPGRDTDEVSGVGAYHAYLEKKHAR